ncbi:hypothetical protein JK359_01025 [Streptomyces actinomycinicus]|uniref:Secreted protein n=1 Tax=Streptomyces actinomycinicus TaxID=1695166 RepID=A0A937EE98_9ACTN|nr:hypothetical protein [Streptomyces actinomycinicus]MBL1080569.1 hypothetical protein [Streptomyces actinomycinicus]
MRKFQRAAVVAAAVMGLSAFGAGVGFAYGGEDAAPEVTAVANSSANAVAVGGGYYTQPEEHQGQPEEEHQGQPEEQKNAEPEQGYGEHEGE